MRQVDSVHGGAHADDRAKKVDFLFGVLCFQAIHEVEFCSNCPFATSGTRLNRGNDFSRASRDVSNVIDFSWAFWVDKDFDLGISGSKRSNMFGAEHLVNTAVSLP